jgi:hypothetical protein
MKLWPFLFLILFGSSCLSGCRTGKKLTETPSATSPISFEKINADSVVKRIQLNQDVSYFTAKGNVTYTSQAESVDGNLTLYAIKDSAYMAIVKKLGFELARILITKDSFKILDRFNLTYSVYSTKKFIDKYNLPDGFEGIYQILTSGCFLDTSMYYEFTKNANQCYMLGTSEYQTLNYQLDTIRLLPQVFEVQTAHHTLKSEVKNIQLVSGKWIPHRLDIEIVSKDDPAIHLNINWDQIKLDPITSIRFIIPEHYTKETE